MENYDYLRVSGGPEDAGLSIFTECSDVKHYHENHREARECWEEQAVSEAVELSMVQTHQSKRDTNLFVTGIEFPTPRRAYVKNQGICQVLSYHGNGYWIVLNNRDQKLFKHRSDLSFRSAS